jgi:hypothetical protein
MNGYALLGEVQIIHVQQVHFRGAKFMPVRQEKQCAIALTRHDPE